MAFDTTKEEKDANSSAYKHSWYYLTILILSFHTYSLILMSSKLNIVIIKSPDENQPCQGILELVLRLQLQTEMLYLP